MVKIRSEDIKTIFDFKKWIKDNTGTDKEPADHILRLIIVNISKQLNDQKINSKLEEYKIAHVNQFLKDLSDLNNKIDKNEE